MVDKRSVAGVVDGVAADVLGAPLFGTKQKKCLLHEDHRGCAGFPDVCQRSACRCIGAGMAQTVLHVILAALMRSEANSMAGPGDFRSATFLCARLAEGRWHLPTTKSPT
jgi:hypothetical protein